jgi:hypothetical protein
MSYQLEIKDRYIDRLQNSFPTINIPRVVRSLPTYVAAVPGESRRGGRFENGRSLFNTPYWDTVTLESEVNNEVEFYTFQNDPLVDGYFKKQISETVIYEGKSVIEATSSKAAEFRIRGLIWNNDNEYPEDQVRQLYKFFDNAKDVRVVSSRFFDLFDIENIVFETMQTPAIVGYSDCQPYVITCREARDITLELRTPTIQTT